MGEEEKGEMTAHQRMPAPRILDPCCGSRMFPVRDVLALTPTQPVFGHRSGKRAQTHWLVFIK